MFFLKIRIIVVDSQYIWILKTLSLSFLKLKNILFFLINLIILKF